MAFLGYRLVIWRSFVFATSRSVVESLASAVSLVWFTYCLVVLSFCAIVDTESPFVISDQIFICFELRGVTSEHAGFISIVNT